MWSIPVTDHKCRGHFPAVPVSTAGRVPLRAALNGGRQPGLRRDPRVGVGRWTDDLSVGALITARCVLPDSTEVEGGRPLPLNRSGHGSTVTALSVVTRNSLRIAKFRPQAAWLLRLSPVSLPRFAR